MFYTMQVAGGWARVVTGQRYIHTYIVILSPVEANYLKLVIFFPSFFRMHILELLIWATVKQRLVLVIKCFSCWCSP